MTVPKNTEPDERGDDHSDEWNLQAWLNDHLDDGGFAGSIALAIKITLELLLAGGIVGSFLVVGSVSTSVLPGVSVTANELLRALAAGAIGVYGIGTHCHYGDGTDSGGR